MKTVQVNDKKFSLYISENEIKEQVKKVAAAMNEELAGKKPLFLVVFNGYAKYTHLTNSSKNETKAKQI